MFAFIGSVALSANAAYRGDNVTSVKFALVAGVSAVANSSVKAGVLGFFGNPGLDALARNSARFGNKTREQSGNLVAYDYTLYVRRDITVKNGVFRMIEADSIKTKGISNIDKNRLPEGDNFAIEKIWIAEGNHATTLDPKNITNYTNVMSSVQAEFRQAELVITQDTKELLRLPVSSILAGGANTTGSKKDVAYSLENNPVVLIENVPFEINIEFPAAQGAFSASALKFHAEVELFGKKTGRKFV